MAVNVSGGPLDFEASLEDSHFHQAMIRMREDITNTTNSVKSQGNQIESFAKKAAAAAAGFFSIQAAEGFITKMIQVRGNFQQIEIAFTTMLKSKAAADQLMAEAVKLAAVTPFTLQDVATGAKQLLAYGFGAQSITKELTKLGNVAAGVGSQLTDIVYLYGTMKAGGRVTQVDLNQFAGRGIPIYDELAKVIGKSAAEVREYVHEGKIGFPQVEKAFENMTGPAGKFFNLMQEQSKSLTGQLSNLEDAWDRMLNSMGKNQEGLLGDGIQAAIALVDNYEKVIEIIELLILTYGSYRAALLLTTAVTSGMSAAELLHYGLIVMKDKALFLLTGRTAAQTAANGAYTASLATAAAATAAFTALLTALVAIGYSLIQYQDAAEIAENSLTDAKEAGARASENEGEKINGLIKTIKDHNATKREQKAAYDELLLTTKGALDKYSQEEIAAGKGAKAIDEYKKSVEKAKIASEEFADHKELEAQIDAITDKGIKAISTWDQLSISFTNFFKAVKLAMSGDLSGLIDMMDAKTAFKNVKNQKLMDLKGAQYKIETDNPDVKKLIEAERLAKAKEEEEKKNEEAARKTAEQLEKEAAAAKRYNALLEKRNELERQISQDLASAKASALSEEDQAILAINQKYDDQLAKIAKINSTLRDQDKISTVQNEAARNLELGVNGIDAVINGKNGYKEQLEKKQQMFEDYEKAKADLGERLATEMYQDQLGNYKSYADYITKDIESRKGQTGLLATKKNEIAAPIKAANDRNEQQNYNELLAKTQMYEQAKLIITEKYNTEYAKLNGKAAAGRRAVLTKSYQDDLDNLAEAQLRKTDVYKKAAEETLLLTREQTIKQVAALESILGSQSLPVDQVTKIQKGLDSLKFNLKIGVDQGNINGLKDEFARTAAQLQATDEDGNQIILSDADYKSIITRLAAISIHIKEIDSDGDGSATWGDRVSKNLDYLTKGTIEVAAGVSKDLGQLSSGFNELSDAVGGNNTQAGYLLGTIGELAGAASDAAGAFSSFASGDIIGGITKTISAVTKVLSIGKKVKEMNAAARLEVEEFYKNAIAGEREYQDMLKERELQTIRNNKIALQGIRDEMVLRKLQSDAYEKEAAEIMAKLQGQSYVSSETYEHGTWFRKASVNKNYDSLQGKSFTELSNLLAQGKLEGDAKALVERLKELEQKGYDAEKAIADLAKETSELFTGTTSDNLTNTLAEMFASGKTSAKDLADFFKETMDDAALSIFKNKVLAGAMESFYKEFDKASQSGDELTADEIATLNGLFTSLTGDALKKFEEFQRITGSTLGGSGSSTPSSTAMEGQIKNISYEQADKLTGQFNGFRLTQLQTNEILKLQESIAIEQVYATRMLYASTQNIESYTLRTANNTDALADMKAALISMDKKMSNNTDYLKSTGRV